MSRALQIVQKFYPTTKTIQDATKNLEIEVTATHAGTSRTKDHTECAMAVACKEKYHLDGVVIARQVAYLVKDGVATRYEVPESVAREVVSFDRGAGFAPGDYELRRPSERMRLGESRNLRASTTHTSGQGTRVQARHITNNIRTMLGGAEGKPVQRRRG